MSSQPPIRVVCFDLGGVFIRICRSWIEGLQAAGLPVRDGIREPLHDGTGAIRRLVFEYQTGRTDCDGYFERFSQIIGGLYAPDEVERVHRAWMRGSYAGVGDLVDALNNRGIVTAALSNTNHAHWDQIRSFPAVGQLQRLFASHIIGHHKPDPGAYEHVERELGHAGAAIMFFDDLAENVEAACARGWHGVLIDHSSDTAAQMRRALTERGALRGDSGSTAK